jgi:hypothetical protein
VKAFQMRLSDELHAAIKEIADERDTTVADVIRESLETFAIGVCYAQEGKRLYWEDPKTGERAEVLVPGYTLRSMKERALATR